MRHRLAIVLAGAWLLAAPAAAQDPVSGGLQGHFLASTEGDLGGALSADVGYAVDVFRFGGFFGVGAVPSGVDERNRVFMPLALMVGIDVLDGPVGTSVRLRGGLWGGATQAVKLTAGGFLSAAAYLLFQLGEGVGLGAGFEVWGIFGQTDTVLLSPSVGLTWRPEP